MHDEGFEQATIVQNEYNENAYFSIDGERYDS